MSDNHGFTLLEILIAIAIMMLLLGGGIAAYLRLDKRQTLVNAGKEVELLLRTAQKKAQVGDRPKTGCAHLEGYRVVPPPAGGRTLTLRAVCDTGLVTVQTYDLPTGVTLTNMGTMTFAVLHGGVSGATSVRLDVNNPSYSYTFLVTAGGEIGDVQIIKN